MNYTKQQINNYKSYESIRKAGLYNMFDSRARTAAGLTKDEYLFVMENYSELKEASEARAAEDMLLKAVDQS
jgi:hypothetical protein